MAQDNDGGEASRLIAERLVTARKAAGLTRTEVSRRSGVPYKTLENYERGGPDDGPQVVPLARLTAVLGVSIDWVVGAACDGEYSIAKDDVIVDLDAVQSLKAAKTKKEAEMQIPSPQFVFAFSLPRSISVYRPDSDDLALVEAEIMAELVRLRYIKPPKGSGQISFSLRRDDQG